jgi:hypothetical protein
MKLRVGFFLFVVCVTVVLHSCRRNQPTLVDANRAPDTEVWYAPPDSTEYQYLVHVYWRGVDRDGVVTRYIWTIKDSITPPPLGWNPAERIRDLRQGHFTTRTDSIFSFTAFRNVGGVGLKKNRQAFYISAIDDNGVYDPFPAAVEFIATVDKLPKIVFETEITKVLNGNVTKEKKLFDPAELDTVGMFRPFNIYYSGSTVNGEIRAYKFFPLTSSVSIPNSDVWTEDLTDTLREFSNVDADAIPSGRLRLAAQVRDDAGAESRVDAGQFREGVCQIVVNYEPDTDIFGVTNTFFRGGTTVVDSVNFEDSEPDTVPYNSWVTLFYQGWDNPYDSSLCADVVNECIAYQVQYTRVGNIDGGPAEGGSVVSSTVRWLPEDGEDNNPFGTPDSTSLTLGCEVYDIRVRSVDEYEKPDGTPAEVSITGSFTPVLDDVALVNFDGTIAGDGDTLTWDYWNPANYKSSPLDTLDFSNPIDPQVVKQFFFVISATGHDSPKEQDGAGVKGWLYTFRRTDTGTVERLKTSGFWADGVTVNVLADTIQLNRRYALFPPESWMDDYAALPGYLNTEYDFTTRGRDLRLADVYAQFMYVDSGAGSIKLRLNAYNASVLARWTESMGQRFYLAMKR